MSLYECNTTDLNAGNNDQFGDPQKQLSCLILDDDDVDIKYLTWQLGDIENLNFRITTANSLSEARKIAQSEVFDVYIVDFWLGFETTVPFIHEVSASGKCKGPIIVLSSLDTFDFQNIGLNSGATHFLSKNNLSAKVLETTIRSSMLISERVASSENKQADEIEDMLSWTDDLLKDLHDIQNTGKPTAHVNNTKGRNPVEISMRSSIESLTKKIELTRSKLKVIASKPDHDTDFVKVS